MSGTVAAGEDEWRPDDEGAEGAEGTNISSVAAPPTTPRAPPKPADDRWSATPKTPAAGAGAPTPVRVEMGGNSAPGTGVKEMPGGNTWNAERPAPKPESGSVIAALLKWNPFATKEKASIASGPSEGKAVEMTPLKPKQTVSLGATARAFNVAVSPNATGGRCNGC